MVSTFHDDLIEMFDRADGAIGAGYHRVDVPAATLLELIQSYRAQSTELARLRDLERQCAPELPLTWEAAS